MWFKAHRLDMDYGVTLAEPAFELPTIGHRVFEEFYKTLKPRFSITLADMKSSGASTYEDFLYVIELFGGNGRLSLGAQGMSVAIRGLTRDEDLKLSNDCFTLCENALQNVLPKSGLKFRKLGISSWSVCEGGAEAVTNLLHSYAGKSIPFEAGDYDIKEMKYHLGADFITESEGWFGKIVLEMSALQESDLYYRLETAYQDGSRYSGLESQMEHTRKLYFSILGRFGLEPFETTKSDKQELESLRDASAN